jgi:hypothetical protein
MSTSTTEDPKWQATIRKWGHAYTFAYRRVLCLSLRASRTGKPRHPCAPQGTR